MDGDGTVDINDLTIVLANFGTTYGSAAGTCRRAGALRTVLIGLGVVSLVACTWRRRR